jgi:hypothetical protein
MNNITAFLASGYYGIIARIKTDSEAEENKISQGQPKSDQER